MNIMSKVKTVNVADDQDFQREFDFFYKVRRNAEWRKVFFEIFERKKKKNCSYKEIITELYEGTGQVEASFASKMLASIDENMPIWDSKVLDRIGIKSSNKRGQQKLEETIELYDVIVQWYSDLKANKASYNEYITSLIVVFRIIHQSVIPKRLILYCGRWAKRKRILFHLFIFKIWRPYQMLQRLHPAP